MDKRLILAILYVFSLDGGVKVDGLKNVKKGEYPFMAYLYYPNEKSEWRRFLEAAILVTPEWLVSSAIDLEYNGVGSPSRQLTARMGTIVIDSKFGPPQDDEEQERQILEIVRSRESWWKREINMLRAAIPFEITDNVKPVPITTAKANLEGETCHVLVYSQYTIEGEDKYLIEFSVTMLESDVETCGKNFDQRAMTCGQYMENVTTIIDPDFCQDNSGGPLICNGEVIGLQSFVDNDDCKPPYYYQMFWAWNQFITCGTKDCEGDCDVICTSKYRDETTTNNNQMIIMSNTSSEQSSNEQSLGDFSSMLKKTSSTTEIDLLSILEKQTGKEILRKEESDSHEKEIGELGVQVVEKTHDLKEIGNIALEEDHTFINLDNFSQKISHVNSNGGGIVSNTNQNTENKIVSNNYYSSLIQSNDTVERKINLDLNNDKQKEHSRSSSLDIAKELKVDPEQAVPENDSLTYENNYLTQSNITTEENEHNSEAISSSKTNKQEQEIKETHINSSENVNDTEENNENSLHKELLLYAHEKTVLKNQIDDNSPQSSNNKIEHSNSLIESEILKSKSRFDNSKEIYEVDISGEIKNANESEANAKTNELVAPENEGETLVRETEESENEKNKNRRLNELTVPENEREFSKQNYKENVNDSEKDATPNALNAPKVGKETLWIVEDNTKVETIHNLEEKENTTRSDSHMISNERYYLEKENNDNIPKEIKIKSDSQTDNTGNESVISEQEKEDSKDESEYQNKLNSKHKDSEEEPSSTQNDKNHGDDNYKENKTSESKDHAEFKKISGTDSNVSTHDMHSEDHAKGDVATTSDETKSENKEEYSNHSTEPNESHSNHIVMEVTNVVIKTVEDLLYAHRNSSRQYGPRTTVDMNDTDISLTPRPKFGKVRRTTADRAGSRTQHTLLHCLFIGTLFDMIFVVLF